MDGICGNIGHVCPVCSDVEPYEHAHRSTNSSNCSDARTIAQSIKYAQFISKRLTEQKPQRASIAVTQRISKRVAQCERALSGGEGGAGHRGASPLAPRASGRGWAGRDGPTRGKADKGQGDTARQ